VLSGIAAHSPKNRHRAVCYTDLWAVYAAVLPSKRHRAVGNESGQTTPIERMNNTLRQRVGRVSVDTVRIVGALPEAFE